jgi:hypothetical protein
MRPRFAAVSIAFLIAASTFAAGHDVASPTLAPTSYAVADPRVATNGDTFLTLWSTTIGTEGQFIYASVADSGGHAIAPSFRLLPFGAQLIDLTAFGTDYVVLWQNAGGLHTSVISGRGVLLGDGPRVPTPTNRFTYIHSNGRTLLFTYHTSDPLAWPTETRAQLTSANGTPIGRSIVLGDQTLQAATAVGDDYVTITAEASGTYFMRLDGNGNVVVPKHRIAPTTSLQNVVAASDGSGILVVTLGNFVALSGDGTVLNTRSVEPQPGSESSLIWTGDAYLHIRRKGFTAVSQRLDRLGMPLDNPVTLNAGVSSAAVHDGIVYAAGRTEDGRIVGFALTAANAPLNGSGDILSTTPAAQTAPVLASDGVDFIAGWTGEIGQGHAFALRRVSRSAMPIDEQQTDLGPVDSPNATDTKIAGPRHAIACAGGTCLVVWQDSNTIRGRWIMGAASASSSFVIGRGLISDRPVVWNGREFFVVWSRPELYSATVSTAGAVSEPAKLMNGYDNLSSPPEVAWDGKHYLLMLPSDTSRCDCQDARSLIEFYTFAVDRTMLGENFFFAWFLDAHLASSGHDFMVTYAHYPAGSLLTSEVAARRVVATDSAPRIDEAIPLFQWFGPMSSSVTWNGTDYVAAWRYGAGSSWWLSEARVTTSAFPARRLTASGIPDRQVSPAIASNAAGESVIAVSESPTLGEPARLRAYAESEVATLPPPLPSTPFAVTVTGSASRATLNWRSDGRDVAGFTIERATPGYGGDGEIIAIASAEDRSIVITGTVNVRVRAFNATGRSDAAIAAVNPRRRAAVR